MFIDLEIEAKVGARMKVITPEEALPAADFPTTTAVPGGAYEETGWNSLLQEAGEKWIRFGWKEEEWSDEIDRYRVMH